MPSTPIKPLLATIALIVAILPLRAQTTLAVDPFDDALPPPTARGETAAPRRVFALLAEIPLPGPLPSGPVRYDGRMVEIPVAEGVARLRPEAGATPQIVQRTQVELEPNDSGAWSESADGELRFGSLPSGHIVAERRCRRCRRGWKKIWKLRVAGNTPVPPVDYGPWVFFGAMDNRVYCVKRRNGHRVWSVDAGGRIGDRLVLAGPAITEDQAEEDRGSGAVLLVVPNGGTRLLALNPADGLKVAEIGFGNGAGTITGSPAVTDDDKIVLAKQMYREDEAFAVIYALEDPPAPKQASTDPGDERISAPPPESGRR